MSEEKRPLGVSGVDGRIISKWILGSGMGSDVDWIDFLIDGARYEVNI